MTSVIVASIYGSKKKPNFVGETQRAESPVNNGMHVKPTESTSHKNLQVSDEVFTVIV